MRGNNSKQPSQDDSEAKAFIYSYIKRMEPEIAEQYRQEAFTQSQSQQNLERTLSMLPPDFMDALISNNAPHTNYPSLIYNPQPFDNSNINPYYNNNNFPPNFSNLNDQLQRKKFQDKNLPPKQRKLELQYKYISKILLTHRIIGHTRLVRLIIHDYARQFFLTVSSDRTMKLWHRPSLSLMYTFKGHEDDVLSAEISPDRMLIASISNDKSIRIWSLINGSCIDRIIENELWPINTVTFSPCSRYLAIVSEQGRIIVRIANGIDHFSSRIQTKLPRLKTFLLRDTVHDCCFSPGGRLIAAALHSGDLAVFSVFSSKLWISSGANAFENPCDFCFFHPFVPSQIFAVSSKSCICHHYELFDDLILIRSFNAKKTFKRMQSCLFSLSCDASLMFACSLSQMIAWSVGDGRVISKIENLPTACEVSPHPHLPIIVAIVCRSVILIVDTEKNRFINSMFIPDSAFKMDSGNWCENGLDFTATDAIGGIYIFKQSLQRNLNPTPPPQQQQQQNQSNQQENNNVNVNVNRFNNDVNVNAHRNNGIDGAAQTCVSSCYFFPNDFTDSYWDENKGDVEEISGEPVYLNPRDKVMNERGELLIENYRPHSFNDIYYPYVEPPSISVYQEYEDKLIAALNPPETIETENDVLEISDEQAVMNAMINVDNKNLDLMISDNSSSNEEERKNEDSICPTNKYPFWTLIDSVNHNSFFPQIKDRIVYIREGHLEMLKDADLSVAIGKSNVKPAVENEEMWPYLAAFEIVEVTHTKFSCLINMKRLELDSNRSFVDNMRIVDELEICENEPIRTLDYPIGNAPAFVILSEQYVATVDSFEKVMAAGDDVEVFFKKGNSEKKYTGRILDKVDSSVENFTYYNSITIDWGDDFADDGLYSPWEIYSVRQNVIYVPSGSKKDPKFHCCAKIIEKVLETASKRVRSLRPFFKQPFFIRGIIYPSDFGLIKRRLTNNMYRNLISLQFDIKSVMDTQLMLPGHSTMDICYVQLLIDRLNEIIRQSPEMSPDEQKTFLDEMVDFSHFEDDAEELHEENERKKLDREREMRSKKRSFHYKRREDVIVDDDDDIFDEDYTRNHRYYDEFDDVNYNRKSHRKQIEKDDFDDDEFDGYNNNRRKTSNNNRYNDDEYDGDFKDDDDDDDGTYGSSHKKTQRSRRSVVSSGSSANRSAANKKKRKKKKKAKINGDDFIVNDEEEDYYEYYDDEDEDDDFIMQDDDAEVEDVSKVVKTLKASRRERNDTFAREKELGGGAASGSRRGHDRYRRSSYKGSDNSSFEEGSYDEDY
ncbi:hypothetical protein M9Y10_028623 [Tritrichomonas musculus]|uniref:Uncharacterized protein n=1 Tax=Tritrichomonas musculus TaxID=1915356 RepID=A0ABR2KJU9_9EUKA